jgi:serine/threonine protein kinase
MDYSGQILDGRYRILSMLGKGGMGSVWLGRHLVIGRNVAVKFLKAELAESDEMVKRFYREAQASAAIGQSNIIEILDVGVSSDGNPYIVMEYLEGESLSSMLRRTGPIDLSAALAILEPALLALAAAHDKGIIHRDLKPDNIFIAHPKDEPIKIKLIDFGISKFTQTDGMSKLTRTGVFLGTPTYMSPEQIRGDKTIDHRSDLYSIGVILYEMLTGKLPIKGDHHNAVVVNVLIEPPTPPRESFADFPMEAEPLLMRLLSKEPKDRPESARKIITEMKKLASYEKREEHLSLYTSSIIERGCAFGDLGSGLGSNGSESGGSERKGAKGILNELSARPTHADCSKSIPPRRRRRRMILGSVGGAVVVAASVLIFFRLTGEKPGVDEKTSTSAATTQAMSPIEKTTPPSKPTHVSARKDVEISVVGMPEGATLFFDEEIKQGNRFTTAYSANEKTLKISAAGYVDYTQEVLPKYNTMIKVAMKTLPLGNPRTTSSGPVKSSPTKITNKSDESPKGSAEQSAPQTLLQRDSDSNSEIPMTKQPSKLIKKKDGTSAVPSFE